MNAFVAGAHAARAPLSSRYGRVTFAVTTLAVAASALWLRRTDPDVAADIALTGVAFGVCLPLAASALVAHLAGHRRLDARVLPLARHGANRRMALVGLVARAARDVALLGAVLGFVGAVAGDHGSLGHVLADAVTSTWIGALAGLAYAILFSFGSLFGERGGGRTFVLFVDFAVGTGSSTVSAFLPRGHVRSLLGGDPVLGLSPAASAAALLALAITYLCVSAGRVRA